MASISSKPSRYNYYDVVYASNPERAYNNSSEGMHFGSSTGDVIFDGIDLSEMPANAIITGYKLSGSCKTYSATSSSTSNVKFRLVTDYYNGSTTSSSNNYYTAISTSDHNIFSVSGKQDAYTNVAYENTDANSTEIVWMNNNLDKVLGGTKFGIRVFGRRTYLRYLTVAIYYQLPDSSKIYVAEAKVKAVYIGSTKAKAVYIGSTKIL